MKKEEQGEQAERQFEINWSVVGFGAIIVGVVSFVGFLLWLVLFVTHVDAHEFAFTFARFGGQIEILREQGWVVRNPVRYAVHTYDLRPAQIRIDANERVLTTKLVRFNSEGLPTFVKWHGRHSGDDRSKLVEILKSYAFKPNGGADCPFLIIEDESSAKKEAPVVAAQVPVQQPPPLTQGRK